MIENKNARRYFWIGNILIFIGLIITFITYMLIGSSNSIVADYMVSVQPGLFFTFTGIGFVLYALHSRGQLEPFQIPLPPQAQSSRPPESMRSVEEYKRHRHILVRVILILTIIWWILAVILVLIIRSYLVAEVFSIIFLPLWLATISTGLFNIGVLRRAVFKNIEDGPRLHTVVITKSVFFGFIIHFFAILFLIIPGFASGFSLSCFFVSTGINFFALIFSIFFSVSRTKKYPILPEETICW